jgi:hypothetical protein
MTPEAQKWRDHFDNCEKEQLRRFPLCQIPLQELETPLLRAQYEVALAYFQKMFPLDVLRAAHERDREPRDERTELLRRADALRADRATREAFYEHFAPEPLEDFFCLRTEEWQKVFALEESKNDWHQRYSLNWHEFIQVSTLQPKQLRVRCGSFLPEGLPLDSLFVRDWGTLIHPLGGDGGSELWHLNGNEFKLVCSLSGWIS